MGTLVRGTLDVTMSRVKAVGEIRQGWRAALWGLSLEQSLVLHYILLYVLMIYDTFLSKLSLLFWAFFVLSYHVTSAPVAFKFD